MIPTRPVRSNIDGAVRSGWVSASVLSLMTSFHSALQQLLRRAQPVRVVDLDTRILDDERQHPMPRHRAELEHRARTNYVNVAVLPPDLGKSLTRQRIRLGDARELDERHE